MGELIKLEGNVQEIPYYGDFLNYTDLTERQDSNMRVALRWYHEMGVLSIVLTDFQARQTLEYDIEPQDAANAVAHPYPYLYASGQDFDRTKKDE